MSLIPGDCIQIYHPKCIYVEKKRKKRTRKKKKTLFLFKQYISFGNWQVHRFC